MPKRWRQSRFLYHADSPFIQYCEKQVFFGAWQ